MTENCPNVKTQEKSASRIAANAVARGRSSFIRTSTVTAISNTIIRMSNTGELKGAINRWFVELILPEWTNPPESDKARNFSRIQYQLRRNTMSKIRETYQSADWKMEKHVPIIECPDR